MFQELLLTSHRPINVFLSNLKDRFSKEYRDLHSGHIQHSHSSLILNLVKVCFQVESPIAKDLQTRSWKKHLLRLSYFLHHKSLKSFKCLDKNPYLSQEIQFNTNLSSTCHQPYMDELYVALMLFKTIQTLCSIDMSMISHYILHQFQLT